MDEAFFWEDLERYSFIRKMNEYKSVFGDPAFRISMESVFHESELKNFIPLYSNAEEVYKFGIAHQKKGAEAKKLDGQLYVVPYEDNIFLESHWAL